MNRVWIAFAGYAVLAILAWTQLTAPIPNSDFQLRHVVIAILGAFAVSTWVHHRKRERETNASGDKG